MCADMGGSKHYGLLFYRGRWRRFRAPTPMETSPMMAIAAGTGLAVKSIVATENATINPPTSIMAVPRLFQFVAISTSSHGRL
jgi:hypothetical protein